jgi:bacteriocin-type transport-associated protein
MKDVLLQVQEFNEVDVDWFCSTGRPQTLTPGASLITQGEPVESFYIVLEGALAAVIAQPGSAARGDPLAKAFAALEGDAALGTEIARFTASEVADELAVLDHDHSATTVKALKRATVLAVPWPTLTAKLEQDTEFAARFNLAIAVRLASRLRTVTTKLNAVKIAVDPSLSLRKVLFVFRELNDSDVDWLGKAGRQERLAERKVLIQEGQPISALYILLEGSLNVSVSQANNPLSRAYAAIEGGALAGQDIARLSKGEIVGELSFLNNSPPSASVTALENSVVLAIPRQRLMAKIQQDAGFASRFYRALSVLLGDRLRNAVSQVGSKRSTYSAGQSLRADVEYEDELDFDLLEQMELAGTRLDWLLSRLRSG